MAKFICTKCHKISSQSNLNEIGPNCDSHIWVQLDEIVGVYSERDALHDKAFERITKTIHNIFSTGKWVALTISVVLAAAGIMGIEKLFKMGDLQTELNNKFYESKEVLDKAKQLENQILSQISNIRDKHAQQINHMEDSQKYKQFMYEIHNIMNNIWAQGVSPQVLESLNIGRTEFDEIRAEIEYTKYRIEKLMDEMKKKTGCTDGLDNQEESPNKCEKLKPWYNNIKKFGSALKNILIRVPDNYDYYLEDGGKKYYKEIAESDIGELFGDVHVKLASIYLDKRIKQLDLARNSLYKASVIFGESPSSELLLYQGVLAVHEGYEAKKSKPTNLEKATNKFRTALGIFDKAETAANMEFDEGAGKEIKRFPLGPILYYRGFANWELASIEKKKLESENIKISGNPDIRRYWNNAMNDWYQANEQFKTFDGKGHANSSNALAYALIKKQKYKNKDDISDKLKIHVIDSLLLAGIAEQLAPNDKVIKATFKHTKGKILRHFDFYRRAVDANLEAMDLFPKNSYREDLLKYVISALKNHQKYFGLSEQSTKKCEVKFNKKNYEAISTFQWLDIYHFLKVLSKRENWPDALGSQQANGEFVDHIKFLKKLVNFEFKRDLADESQSFLRCLNIAALNAIGSALMKKDDVPPGVEYDFRLANDLVAFSEKYQAFGSQDQTGNNLGLKKDEMGDDLQKLLNNRVYAHTGKRLSPDQLKKDDWVYKISESLDYHTLSALERSSLHLEGTKDRAAIHDIRNGRIWVKLRLAEMENKRCKGAKGKCEIGRNLLREMDYSVGESIFKGEIDYDSVRVFDTLADVYFKSGIKEYKEKAPKIAKLLLMKSKNKYCSEMRQLEQRITYEDKMVDRDAYDLINKRERKLLKYLKCKVDRFGLNKTANNLMISDCMACMFGVKKDGYCDLKKIEELCP